jgi:hypothetical protein
MERFSQTGGHFMDRKVLEAQLRQRCEAAMQASIKAVESAPDGQWIAGSEWEIRDIFQKLTQDCYRDIVQSRIDVQPSASQAAFSPSGRRGGGPARQGPAQGQGVDGGR